MESQRTPPGLAAAGKRLWKSVASKWELRPDERRILEDACFEADLIDVLQRGLTGADLIVRGSMGQQIVNPLISEIRQHRTVLASLMGKLSLPDEQGEAPRSVGARKAAAARWSKPA